MGITTKWRSAVASDAGRVRSQNQDRSYIDDDRGFFLVVDGLGGHAAGEKAAETAVEAIRGELGQASGDAAQRILSAIASANNRILDLAAENADWRGMACVLTLALIAGDKVTVGHVGDSRLYLIWNGSMRKLTSDHSPVGEREDSGELTEEEAMQHPRRHEVFRDVGTRRREPEEEDFVEIKEFLLKPDAAILMCSDGLSDLVKLDEMKQIIEGYSGDPEQVARDLVDAANQAGGKDNITVVFIAASEFIGANSPVMTGARSRHSITRMRAITRMRTAPQDQAPGTAARFGRALGSRAAFLVYGFVIGVLLALAVR
jgi:serine/threonine protein phosphatase PrpC